MDFETKRNYNKLELRPYQLSVLDAIENKGYKRVLILWPRRAGKDYVALWIMTRAALRKVGVYFYVFPQYSQARKALWTSLTSDGRKFLDIIPSQLVSKMNQQEMRITLKNESTIQFLGSDHFDCFDDKTEILTLDGWKLFSNLENTDEVAMLKDGILTYAIPSMIQRYEYDGLMYAGNNSSIDFLVTPNHRFWVRSDKGFFKFKNVSDPTIKNDSIPSQSLWVGKDKQTFVFPEMDSEWITGKGRKVIKKYRRSMLMEDFVALLGIFLAEGSTYADHKKYEVVISQTKEHTTQEIFSLLERSDINYNYHAGRISIQDKQLYTYFSQFGLQNERFIPKDIKSLSPKYLRILFDWLVKGDGHSCDTYTAYYSVSKKLIDDVQEIIIKLGLSGNIHIKPQSYAVIRGRVINSKQILYEIRVRKSSFKRLSSSKKSYISTQPYKGFVYCVTVPSGVIKVRRNGKELWSGNSLRGTNPSAIVYSEYAYQDPRAHQALSPALKYNDGWALFITTVRGKNHAYEMHNIAQANPDVWWSCKLTIDDTQHISRSEIEREIASGEISWDMAQSEYFNDFNIGLEGSYYAKYLDRMRVDGRIGQIPYESAFKVHTAWDIGNDTTAIIFFQTVGQIVRIIDYYENSGSGHGLEHYAKIVLSKPYVYGRHIFPHDMAVTEWGGMRQTRLEKARQLGLNGTICDKKDIEDGIEAVRSALSRIYIDEVNCKQLIRCLENYRQEWDPKRNIYKGIPLHDWSSHGADSARYMALSLPKVRDGLTPEALDRRYNEAMGFNSSMPAIFRDDIEGNERF